ncbi:hypothetical protein PFISCL1PPCAC_25751, partial [Pristionchus fissidentatus]
PRFLRNLLHFLNIRSGRSPFLSTKRTGGNLVYIVQLRRAIPTIGAFATSDKVAAEIAADRIGHRILSAHCAGPVLLCAQCSCVLLLLAILLLTQFLFSFLRSSVLFLHEQNK